MCHVKLTYESLLWPPDAVSAQLRQWLIPYATSGNPRAFMSRGVQIRAKPLQEFPNAQDAGAVTCPLLEVTTFFSFFYLAIKSALMCT